MSAPLASFEQAMAFLSAHTNYEKQTDWSYQRLGLHLDAFREFLKQLGSPHDRLPPRIHVTGTKGKGSTCLMLEAMYRANGFKTGVYTSPHLEHVTERIQINGQPITPERFAAVLESLRPALEAFAVSHRPITFFEALTAMAFVAFLEQPLDVVILEVGLGGRLDATNVVDADVAVITSIGFDHMDKLGATLPEIAREKAGILKPGRLGVIGPLPTPEVRQVFASTAAGLIPPCELVTLDGGDFSLDRDGAWNLLQFRSNHMPMSLKISGTMAPGPSWPREIDRNLACAMQATYSMKLRHPALKVNPGDAMSAGVHAALPGRAERFKLKSGVLVILDGAHNEDSFRAIGNFFREKKWRPWLVLGMNRDKVRVEALMHLHHVAGVVATTVPWARTATLAEISAAWHDTRAHFPVEWDASQAPVLGEADPQAALELALRHAEAATSPAERVVLVTGSFYLAGALRKTLRESVASNS